MSVQVMQQYEKKKIVLIFFWEHLLSNDARDIVGSAQGTALNHKHISNKLSQKRQVKARFHILFFFLIWFRLIHSFFILEYFLN